METDQPEKEDSAKLSGNPVTDQPSEYVLSIPNLNLINSLNVNGSAVLGPNQIVVEAQVHATNRIADSTPKTDYDTATQEEKDRMVLSHIQDQNCEIKLLKDTISKILEEKKTMLRQQNETVCDMNLLKGRLRVAESLEEMEVIKNRIKELQKQKIKRNVKSKQKNENYERTIRISDILKVNENFDSATSSNSSDSDDSEFDLPQNLQKRSENRIAGKLRFLMREEFQKILQERAAKKRAQKEDEVSDNEDNTGTYKRKSQTMGPNENSSKVFIEKENLKLRYTLERTKTNIKTWKQMLMTELSLKRYGDVLDSSIQPPFVFTESQQRERCNIVKGIILSHLDECYQDQVIEIENPCKIMRKLEKLKRDEINETSASIIEQLNKLKYEINREQFVEFFRKFEEIVRKYELVTGEKLGEKMKTDALYRAVVHSVPSLQTATYTDRARGSKGFSFDEIKRYVQQHESENKPSSLQLKQMGLNVVYAADGRITCTKCGMVGHTAVRCKTPERMFKCFQCHLVTDHKAAQCPERPGNQNKTYKFRKNFVNKNFANKKVCENRFFNRSYNQGRAKFENRGSNFNRNANNLRRNKGNWQTRTFNNNQTKNTYKNRSYNNNQNKNNSHNNNGNFRPKFNNNFVNSNKNQKTKIENKETTQQ